mmetsp:Transcript_48195/g.56338  ORF Transcript_48195/g.56338 Transcript_48195/m.56338 type:complete len:98 (+) Transcript_48195:179-472(+)
MVKSNDLSTSSTNKPLNTICGRSDQSRRPGNLANTRIAAKEIVSAHTRKIPYHDSRSPSLLFASTRSILERFPRHPSQMTKKATELKQYEVCIRTKT